MFYVFGDGPMWTYDRESDTWERLPRRPFWRKVLHACHLVR